MSDTEIIALAAIANVEAALMAGDNAIRANRGEYPMWSDGTGFMPATTTLYNELQRRKLIP